MRFYTQISKSKNSLKVFERTQNLLKLLKEELKGYDWAKNKYNNDIIEKLCNLVESEFNSNKKAEVKVNKKEKVFELIGSFVSLSDEDKRIIGETIEHLHNTGRIRLPSNKQLLYQTVKFFFMQLRKVGINILFPIVKNFTFKYIHNELIILGVNKKLLFILFMIL